MKKTICSFALLSLMGVLVSSCNKQAPKVDEKPVEVSKADAGMKIAYIEVDSIMSQYKFCKEYSLILEKKVRIYRIQSIQKDVLYKAQLQNFNRTYRTINILNSRQRLCRPDYRSRMLI